MEPVLLPVTAEFKRKRKLAMIVTVVSVLIAVAAFVGTYSYSVKTVNILSVELSISYENSSTKWLGPQTQFLTANYQTLEGGSYYRYSIVLINHSSETQHLWSITSRTAKFFILETGLQTPMTFEPGQSVNLNLLIHLPDYNFVGVLDLVLVVS